jgi:hypothetical protein
MTKVLWDQSGGKVYETGVDRGVLYLPNGVGAYDTGFAWNGLTTVTESPSGAEPNKQYADNIIYATLLSYEEFGGTIEAYTYPDEFAQCDGTAAVEQGVYIGQQDRKVFGFSYRTLVGNDIDGNAHGYKLHLVYGALASPSEKANATINDSPELVNFSWDFTTTPVEVGTINSVLYKPTSYICVDSTKVDADALAALEDFLYGTVGTDPSLPTPAAVAALFAGTITVATPTVPSYDSGTHTITIPTVTGITYRINGVAVAAGPVVLTTGQSKIVVATPNNGYKLPAIFDNDWMYTY